MTTRNRYKNRARAIRADRDTAVRRLTAPVAELTDTDITGAIYYIQSLADPKNQGRLSELIAERTRRIGGAA
jgi:hypothetical protein